MFEQASSKNLYAQNTKGQFVVYALSPLQTLIDNKEDKVIKVCAQEFDFGLSSELMAIAAGFVEAEIFVSGDDGELHKLNLKNNTCLTSGDSPGLVSNINLDLAKNILTVTTINNKELTYKASTLEPVTKEQSFENGTRSKPLPDPYKAKTNMFSKGPVKGAKNGNMRRKGVEKGMRKGVKNGRGKDALTKRAPRKGVPVNIRNRQLPPNPSSNNMTK